MKDRIVINSSSLREDNRGTSIGHTVHILKYDNLCRAIQYVPMRRVLMPPHACYSTIIKCIVDLGLASHEGIRRVMFE